MDKTKEFIKEIDILVNEQWTKIFDSIEKHPNVKSVTFKLDIDIELFKKYNLNENFHILVITTAGDGKIGYYYKKENIEPESYYILPKKYHEVTLLEIFQECIIQDTANPDIKHLQNKEYVN